MEKWYDSLPENKKLIVQSVVFVAMMIVFLVVETLIQKGD